MFEISRFDTFCYGTILAAIVISYVTVDSHYDIRKYYNKPYCEKAKIGNSEVEKCYKLMEIQK